MRATDQAHLILCDYVQNPVKYLLSVGRKSASLYSRGVHCVQTRWQSEFLYNGP
jgi:hypothetical protein